MLLEEQSRCQAPENEFDDYDDEADFDEVITDRLGELLASVAKASGPHFAVRFPMLLKPLLRFTKVI